MIVAIDGPAGAGKSSAVASWLEVRKLASIWYHVDPGDADPATFNSSSAQLDLPAGATVLFAGLYWGGRTAAGGAPGAAGARTGSSLSIKLPTFMLPRASSSSRCRSSASLPL